MFFVCADGGGREFDEFNNPGFGIMDLKKYL